MVQKSPPQLYKWVICFWFQPCCHHAWACWLFDSEMEAGPAWHSQEARQTAEKNAVGSSLNSVIAFTIFPALCLTSSFHFGVSKWSASSGTMTRRLESKTDKSFAWWEGLRRGKFEAPIIETADAGSAGSGGACNLWSNPVLKGSAEMGHGGTHISLVRV